MGLTEREAESGKADELERRRASLEEELFAFAATGIRKLKRHRKYLQPVLETAAAKPKPIAVAAPMPAGVEARAI